MPSKNHVLCPLQARRKWGGQGGMYPPPLFGRSVQYYVPPQIFRPCDGPALYPKVPVLCRFHKNLNNLQTCFDVTLLSKSQNKWEIFFHILCHSHNILNLTFNFQKLFIDTKPYIMFKRVSSRKN